MLTLCQTTGYAILALRELPPPGGPPMLARDIALRTSIPGSYLAKIVHRLGEAGIVHTKRGHKGGIVLARPPNKISLLEISEAMNPNDWKTECLFGLSDCRQLGYCPMHGYWKSVRDHIRTDLAENSLADLPSYRIDPHMGSLIPKECAPTGPPN